MNLSIQRQDKERVFLTLNSGRCTFKTLPLLKWFRRCHRKAIQDFTTAHKDARGSLPVVGHAAKHEVKTGYDKGGRNPSQTVIVAATARFVTEN